MQNMCCDHDKTMELCQLAGRIMLSAGGETYRVEDTISRIAIACGTKAESYVTPTGIFITLYDGDNKASTAVTRVTHRTINLDQVTAVNGISRDLFMGSIGSEEAYRMLHNIANAPPGYSSLFINVCAGIASGSFAYLFGGTLIDVVLAGITGTFVNIIFNFFLNRQATVFLSTFIAALFAGIVALVAAIPGLAIQPDKIIIGGIMPLLPGVALTNGVRDMIAGDLVSGVARTVEAILIAAAIAVGVIIVLAFVI